MTPLIEQLELRRLFCTLGIEEDIEGESRHLFDQKGQHLNLTASLDTNPQFSISGSGPSALGPGALSSAVKKTGSGQPLALQSVAAPSGALNGKVVYMNGGHGWTWSGSAWLTQRPEYQEMVEDLQTQDQISFYAHYLLNAGATVVPTRPLGHQLNEVIVDNNDAGFSIQSGSWSTNTGNSTYWSNVNGTDNTNRYRFASVSATETAVARFTPNIPSAGWYPVYAWYQNGSNRSTGATYRINSGGGSQEVKVNQRYTGRGWVYLGTHYFDAGTAGNVEVSNKASDGSVVIADAIRFGNGMGDWDANGATAGGTSGKPREEELSLYWAYRSRGYTGSGTLTSSTFVDGGVADDGDAGIGTPPRWSAYMNDDTQGTVADRVFLSFHSNGSTGEPDATARGTIALVHSTASSKTPNMDWWANAISEEVEEDMQALPAGTLEHPWASRTNVLAGQYGEISNVSADGEFSTTLLEVAFHDNLQDSQLMRDPKVRDCVARASYQATAKYFQQFDPVNTDTNPDNNKTYTLLPDVPTNLRATTNANGNVVLNWTAPAANASTGGAGAATGYKVYYGANGYNWSDVVTLGNVTSHTFTAGTLPAGQMTYFRVVATNAGGESLQREVVVAKAQAGRRAPILIVNGFDRFDRTTNDTTPWDNPLIPNPAQGGTDNLVTERVRTRYQNTRDYVVQFAEAVEAHNGALGVETAQNEQVANGTFNLANYHTILWISGEESTGNQTFDAAERSLLTTFLNNGGKLFVSGAEIGWHLDAQAGDPAFYNNLLKADYVSDDAGTYTTSGVAGSIFAGISSIVFDNGADALPAGSFGTYDVDTPDVIAATGGSTAALTYSTGTTAAVQYSSGNTRVVTMGFPFETIKSATKRNDVMNGVLSYFGTNSTILSPTPSTLLLAAATDSGSSNSDRLTNFNNSSPAKALQVAVSGTLAGATVRIYAGNQLIGTATGEAGSTVVTTSGAFTLAEGGHNISATQQEANRTESLKSAVLAITVDTVAPAAPPAPDLDAASDSGASNTDNLTNDATPTLGGTFPAPPTAIPLTLYRDGLAAGSTSAGSTWSITSAALPDGTYAFTTTIDDSAGNTSAPSDALDVTVDTVGPTVTGYSVNGGGIQRSRVTSLVVSFDQAVSFGPGAAFTLVRRSDQLSVTTTAAEQTSGDADTWVLTFSGAGTQSTSLADGIWDLSVVAANVTDVYGNQQAANGALAFHRLFGDGDGDGDVDDANLSEFRSTFGKFGGDPGFLWYFDFVGDGDVDNADLFQFRQRNSTVFIY